MAFPLPNEYGWVMLVASLTFFLNFFQIFMIARLRRRYSIEYPKMLSLEHEDFNCAQRVHQNTLEFTPFFLVNLVLGGLGYPIYAASFGLVFVLGRVVYSIGYYSGKPVRRLPGFYISLVLGLVPLIVLNIISAIDIIGY